MTAPHEIAPAQLARLLGTPEAPLILDLCLPEDFALDPRVIPTARRAAHGDVAALAPRLAGRRTVAVCQKGRKVSQGAAALLRAHGIPAEHLAGGVHAWRDAGLPLTPLAALPAPIGDATLWVTRHRPKIDRIACPWLIRRWVDPGARFLFVAPSEVAGVAERFGAAAFDTEGAPFTHDGPLCTFDAMLRAFALDTEPLQTMAKVIRAADAGDHAAAPQAAGLLALSVGLSRMHRDDLAQLEAGMILYDALHRWARDGQGEGHGWPAGHGA